MKRIISTQGNKNSGKDETSKFICYLLNTPRFMHHYWLAKLLNFKSWKKDWKITRYADPLKKMCAILLNVPVEYFEDRDFKENWYFDFNEYKFYHRMIVYKKDMISDKEFSRQLKKGNLDIILQYKLSVRQILQCFGTDVMRRFFGDKLWINITLSQDIDNMIISDQRFMIENETVRDNDSFIIHITRPGCEAGNHPSEKELTKLYQKKQYDILIENDGTLEDLFDKCKTILNFI